MNKQTSPMFFLVTLIFIFLFCSSANALPKGIEKRSPCEQITRYCTLNPQQGNPNQQVEGEIHFQQQVDCSVIVQGQFNTVHYPDATGYDTLFENYDFHITLASDAAEPSKVDLENYITTATKPPKINEPYFNSFPKGLFPVDFFTLIKYHCVVAYDDCNNFGSGSEDVILGSAPILAA
ncbi:13658_t:CDS:1 [Ambispora gerdemannii]|uniref:13658_t:CDS:1 n=1 Tax=Ambispora gerdemannii TaxID=144530 RepID=A0A9N9AJG7_9GLOM|nr:13658_t:CDS:1 [Ambispora gerdemannii]